MDTTTNTPTAERVFIPTSEKVEVQNYPYGFKLRTTLYDYIEWDSKKGYRHCTQTINPKNGRINNPKKSTYYPFMLRYKNEDGHIKTFHIDFNVSFEDINVPAKKVIQVWETLDQLEKEYLMVTFKSYAKLACLSSIQYGGTNQEVAIKELKKLTEYINTFANIEEKKIKGKYQDVIVSYNVDTNIFENLPEIDKEALKNATPENYQPFKMTTSVML